MSWSCRNCRQVRRLKQTSELLPFRFILEQERFSYLSYLPGKLLGSNKILSVEKLFNLIKCYINVSLPTMTVKETEIKRSQD